MLLGLLLFSCWGVAVPARGGTPQENLPRLMELWPLSCSNKGSLRLWVLREMGVPWGSSKHASWEVLGGRIRGPSSSTQPAKDPEVQGRFLIGRPALGVQILPQPEAPQGRYLGRHPAGLASRRARCDGCLPRQTDDKEPTGELEKDIDDGDPPIRCFLGEPSALAVKGLTGRGRHLRPGGGSSAHSSQPHR